MQYALVDDQRRVASPGQRGECPHCGSAVLAKCGERKVWHWSHTRQRNCDRWWEAETEWHRKWKAHFPTEWHEVGHVAEDGERHIADIKTSHGLVIEFQHSALASLERNTRTDFYGDIVWVVDGMRRKNDRPRFEREAWNCWSGKGELRQLYNPDWALPNEWLDCRVPVFFDFNSKDSVELEIDYRRYGPPRLWCLLPKFSEASGLHYRLMQSLTVDDFISGALNGHPMPDWVDILSQHEKQRREQAVADHKAGVEYQKRLDDYRRARMYELRAQMYGRKWRL